MTARAPGTAARLEVFPRVDALAHAAADVIRSAAADAVRERGRFTLALAGGSTPRAVYSLLSADRTFPWSNTEFCFGDERAVPPDHPDSNARMVRQTLLREDLAPPERVHRIRAELPPAEAAADYEQVLRALFAGATLPRFDLILLGLGADGHTASLFPGSPALHERSRWVADNWAPALGVHRVTLTLGVLNAAAAVLFLVSGRDKAAALRATLAADGDDAATPARAIRPANGSLRYLVDADAASDLDPR